METDVDITISTADRARLEAIVAVPSSPRKHVWRATIILLSADGVGTMAIAREAGVAKPTVWRWHQRFLAEGVAGLLCEKSRPPGIAPLPAETIARVVALTGEPPPGEATHWTVRAMAEAIGISRASGQRIRRAHGLRPHPLKSFKLSKGPAFAEKLQDIVGLYVDPPAHAVVLSLDEKSQIQALDRTQPGLPIKPRRLGTMARDYKRHGTTTLFAALNVLKGTLIGRCMARHGHQEFTRFLNAIGRTVPAGKAVHVILDNYATHKHPKEGLLVRHPRFVFHFTPTSASWLNAVETFFATPTRRRLKRAVFRSIVDSRPPSTASSTRTTMIPNRSSGPPIPTASWPASAVGIEPWRQSTRSGPHSALGWLPPAPEVVIPLDPRPTIH